MGGILKLTERISNVALAIKGAWKFPSSSAQNDWLSNWSTSGPWLPGSRYDYRNEAGDLLQNSIIAACLAWAVRTFPEPNLEVLTKDAKGEESEVPNHSILPLLTQSPNPDDSAMKLWASALVGYVLDGNAYWYKERGALGNVVSLRSIPYQICGPMWKADGSEYISAYGYYVDGKRITLPKEDVIHFRFPVDDPLNDRKGYSPLKSLLREVCTDNEAATYGAAIMRNFGVMGLVFSPKDPTETLTPEQQDRMARSIQQKTTGERRGEAMVLSGAMDVTNLAVSPESMAIEKIRRIPEERISAAIGIPAVVVGLGAGLDRSTYANMEEAGRQAYEQFLMPTQAAFADTLTRFLLPEFGDITKERLAWDYSLIAALQENQDDLAKRAAQLFTAGIIDRAQALNMIGMVDTPADAGVYYSRPGALATVPGAAAQAAYAKGAMLEALKSRRIEMEREMAGKNGRN